MIIDKITRNINTYKTSKPLDYVYIEWFEATKRIQRLTTESGMDIAVRLLGEDYVLSEGTILFEDQSKLVVVSIKPCTCICITTQNPLDIAFIANEIGNKHAPLFVEDNKLVMPYENALFQWLVKHNLHPEQQEVKLLNPLNPSIDPKIHAFKKGSSAKIPLFITQ